MKTFTTKNKYSGKDPRGDDGLRELQTAIFEQAVRDYKDSWRDLKWAKNSFGPHMKRFAYDSTFRLMAVIRDVEGFADSDWGQVISPFSEPEENLFKEGLQWLRVKNGYNRVWNDELPWHRRLLDAARKCGKTQKSLARKAKVDETWFGKMLYGETLTPDLDEMLSICRALDVSPVWVLFGTDKETYWDWEVNSAMKKHDKEKGETK